MKMEKHITDERTMLEYELVGDYYLLAGDDKPEEHRHIGKWGVLLSIVTALFFIAVGILLGSVCSEKAIGGVASIIITCQSLLSGMWFLVDKLSGGFIFAMRCLPFKSAADLIQNVLNGVTDPAEQFLKPLLIVLAYTIPVLVAAILCFRAKMMEK